jgi:predicted NAD/FAD-dependent oxidoreductase
VTTRRIAVVGAGIAGLAAARRLARGGCDVVVLDKARGPGGRSSTRRVERFAFDHGAQYFTCRDPAFQKQVSDWCERGVVARWDGPIARLERGSRRDAPGDAERFVGVPRMSAVARDLASELRVECGQRIERIERPEGRWHLLSETGRAFERFDAVVIATPAPQAAPLLAADPQLARRVAEIEMQPCHAVMVAFAQRVDADFGGAFVAGSPLAWVARNASKPCRAAEECWVLHATPEWSAARLHSSPTAIAAALVDAFSDALGRALPRAAFSAAHRWRYARTTQPLGQPFLRNPDLGLAVCGDWTLGDRVEHAFQSGDRLARAMLDTKSLPRDPV